MNWIKKYSNGECTIATLDIEMPEWTNAPRAFVEIRAWYHFYSDKNIYSAEMFIFGGWVKLVPTELALDFDACQTLAMARIGELFETFKQTK